MAAEKQQSGAEAQLESRRAFMRTKLGAALAVAVTAAVGSSAFAETIHINVPHQNRKGYINMPPSHDNTTHTNIPHDNRVTTHTDKMEHTNQSRHDNSSTGHVNTPHQNRCAEGSHTNTPHSDKPSVSHGNQTHDNRGYHVNHTP